MNKRKVTWTKKAIFQFNKAIQFIRKDSEQNAEKVRVTILEKVNSLEDGRLVHRQDQYKRNNDGNFLYGEIINFRIVYYSSAS